MQSPVQEKNRIAALYPLTKFYLAIIIIICAFFLNEITGKIVCFGVVNLLAAASGIYSTFFKRTKNSMGLLFIILLVIQTFFYPGKTILFSAWIFSAKLEGLLFALNLGFTLLNVGGILVWFFAVTREKDFVLALEKKGLSPKASYVVLSTLQMVPVLKKKSQTIMDAQKTRGVETEGSLMVRAKVFVPTILPLVLSSISGTEERALTLEARGFSSAVQHTYLNDIVEQPADKKVKMIINICFILFLVGRVILWVI